jgi:hypothetical protein
MKEKIKEKLGIPIDQQRLHIDNEIIEYNYDVKMPIEKIFNQTSFISLNTLSEDKLLTIKGQNSDLKKQINKFLQLLKSI